MDALELLKSKWSEREKDLPTLTYNDIYKMLLKKSSSIVKWIFAISIVELIFWIVLGLTSPESNKEFLTDIGLQPTLNVLYVIHYAVIAIFLALFYLNYKNIKTTDTVKTLMQSIIKTRKTVTYFVIYNVASTVLVLLYINLYFFSKKDQLYLLLKQGNDISESMAKENFTSVFFIAQFAVGVLLIGFILLFYRIVYGILLKRLKGNYLELKKIEL
tara:strand:- start:18300 stop:18947 length:648 start_codon:yes stop_codon:yes gene_type:complete